MKKLLLILLTILSTTLLTACEEKHELLLATTTSVDGTGLMSALIEEFNKEYPNYDVSYVAVGTGSALELGQNKDVDLLLVHAKDLEIEFVNNGYGTERYPLMYNYFYIVGPTTINIPNTILLGMTTIKDNNYTFVSRGDNSGTHIKELSIWENLNIDTDFSNYIEAGQSMTNTLIMANELQGFTLTDNASFIAMSNQIDLEVKIEADDFLYNEYGLIKITDLINEDEADLFIEFLLLDSTQQFIKNYRIEGSNQNLFYIFEE